MSDISTARALEVCLARVRMPQSLSMMLAGALNAERAIPSQSPTINPDEITARIRVALYHLDGADTSFSKKGLIDRITDARAELRQILGKNA